MSANFVIDVYTDGACSGNPGPGAFGAILKCQGKTKEIHGPSPLPDDVTTNNLMEVYAVSQAINAIKLPKCHLVIHTDSNNVIGWLDKGWKCKSNPTIKDWINQIILHCQYRSISFEFVKVNDETDPLCKRAHELAHMDL